MDTEPRHTGESEPTALQSGRVRIVGAEPAGKVAPSAADEGTTPPVEGAAEAPPDELPPWPTAGEPAPGGTELPHWTEAPTGEVPAVLSRGPEEGDDAGGDPWASLPSPTWREERSDWTAQEETFEPSMLAQEDTKLGSLDDSGESDRQPWSFDLPSGEVQAVTDLDAPLFSDDDTMVVPVVGRAADPPGEVVVRFDELDSHDDQPNPTATTPGTTAHPGGDGPLASAPPAVPIAEATSTVAGDTLFVSGAGPDPLDEFDAGEPPSERPRRALGLGRASRRRMSRHLAPEEADAELAAAGAIAADEEAGNERQSAATKRVSAQRPVPPAPVDREPSSPTRPVPPAPQAPPPRRPPPRPPEPMLQPPEPVLGSRDGRNLPIAVASGLVLGIVALICFKLGTVTSLIIVTVLVTLAAMEVFAAFRRAGYRPATLLGLVATVSLMVATYNKGVEALPLVVVLVFAFTMLWHLVGVDPGAEPVRSTASTMLVFCWVGVFGSFAALLLDPTLFPDRHGIAFLLGAIITGVAYDVGALAVGAWMGSHPLSPASPNKTWEGVAGGGVAAVLAGLIFVHLIHPWTLGAAVTLGIVVAIVSPIGDLSESLVKRNLGLKDMGRILPGHGGLMDRFDGILFVLPATYYLVKAFHLG